MKLFAPENPMRSQRNRDLYATYELIYTAVDFAAAILFLIGSVLFFYQSEQTPAIWCFVVGSICFTLKPTLKLTRELHYLSIGDIDDLAARAQK